MIIRPALQTEHKEILKISKQSPYTKDFSNSMMFSSEAAYAKGWIRVAVGDDGIIDGFTCFRVKKREPVTVLYFVGVRMERKRVGLGWWLVQDMMEFSPNKRLKLNVAKDNIAARAFYDRHGFWVDGDSLGGKGLALSKDF